MKKVPLLLLGAIMLLAWTIPSAAQATRESIIADARDEAEDSRAIALYLSALDPALGSPDSLWAVVTLEIADRLTFLDQQPLASTWLHWLARHGAQWDFDREYYDPALIEEYERAMEAVAATSEATPATTTWRWPEAFDPASRGTVEATAFGQPASVSVEGPEPAEASGSLSLLPGTYTLVVSAEGYAPVEVVREILPGVTTLLDVEAVPILTSEVQGAVAENLVRITYTIGGQEICRNGLLAGSDGLVVTSLASIQDGVPLRVSAFEGREVFSDVPVLTTDLALDLAVLQLGSGGATALPGAPNLSGGQFVWSVHYQGCADFTSSRTRLGDWPPAIASEGQVATPLPAEAIGAPLVDRSGSLLGLITGSTTFVPVARADDLLAQARQDLSTRAEQAREAALSPEISSGGKFPWKWVGAGLGVAGVAVALTSGGGGGGGGGTTDPPPPTTGGIKVIWTGGG